MNTTNLSTLPTCLPTSQLLNTSWFVDGACLGKPESIHMTEQITQFFHSQCLHLIKDSQQMANKYFKDYDVQLTNVLKSAKEGYAYLVHVAALLGTDMNQPINKLNDTLLHQACRDGNLEIVKILENLGVDLNALNGNKDTPLSLAADYVHTHIVTFLVSKRAKVETVNNHNRTPLLHAVIRKDQNSTKALLKAGANPNFQIPVFNTTPFMFAISLFPGEIIADFINAGAKPDLCDALGSSVLSRAIEFSERLDEESKRILREWCNRNNLDCPDKHTNLSFASKVGAIVIFILSLYGLNQILKKKKPHTDKIKIKTERPC